MSGYGIRAKTGLIEGLELKGVTGSFSGSLTVKELIGGGVIEHALFKLKKLMKYETLGLLVVIMTVVIPDIGQYWLRFMQ